MKESSVNTTTFKLQKEAGSTGTTITATVTYAPATKTATLDPTKKLKKSGAYVATVTSGAQDQAGNALDQDPSLPGNQDKRWTFKVRR
jgi:Bacterial Ig-like domain